MRQAKLDAQGVLLEHGFCDYGAAGLAVPDDFALTPGSYRWNGTAWTPYSAAKVVTVDPVKALATAKIDTALSDPTVPASVKDALAAIKSALA